MTTPSFKFVSVLIFVNADAENLAEVARELDETFESLETPYEVLFILTVDEDSIRQQLDEARSLLSDRVRVLEFSGVADDAAVLATGADRAEGDVILTLPARFEVDFAVIGRLLDAVASGADVVVAHRQRANAGNSARLQSEIFNRLISIAGGTRFRDLASSTRALRPEVLREVPLYGDFHRYLPMLARRLGFNVEEVPAAQHPKATPHAIPGPLLYLWRSIDVLTVFFISRFTRHPLRLFGGLGAAFAGVGGILLLVLGIQRLAGTPLADRPILVVPVLLVGLGVQAFAIGLLGELILFFQTRHIRDYRIARIHESGAVPPRVGTENDSDSDSKSAPSTSK